MKTILILTFLPLFLILPAQPGTLNTGFGNNGYLQVNLDTLEPLVTNFFVHSNNKITVCGSFYHQSTNGSYQSLFLARFNADGTPDQGFGINGFIQFPNSNYNLKPVALHVYSNGSVLVGGVRRYNGVDAAFLQKFTSNGNYDLSFNNYYGQRILFSGAEATLTDMHVDANDRIYICGGKKDPTQKAYVARFSSAGSLDLSFSGDGIAIVDFGYSSFNAMSLSSTRVYAVGSTGTGDMVAASLNISDGNLYTGFDTDGKLTFEIASGVSEYAYDIAYHFNNRLVICGVSNSEPFICQLNANGSFDNNFSGDGKLVVPFGGSHNWGGSLTISPFDYSVYMTVSRNNSPTSHVVQINSLSGTLVPEFGTAGVKDVNYFPGKNVKGIKTIISNMRLYMLNMTYVPSLGNAEQAGFYVMDYYTGADQAVFYNNTASRITPAIRKTNESFSKIYSQGQHLLLLGNGLNDYYGYGYGGVTRYFTDGTADPSFLYYPDESNFSPRELVVNSDMSFVMGGTRYNPQTTDHFIQLAKRTSDGDFDTLFGTGSYARFNIGPSYCSVHAILTLQDGSIITVGNISANGLNPYAWKVNAAGNTDLNFDGDGIWQYAPSPNTTYRAYDAFLDQNGYIIIAGLYENTANNTTDAGFLTLAPDGSPVGNIVLAGMQENSTSYVYDFGSMRVEKLPDGRFYLLAPYRNGNRVGVTVARFHADFTLDVSFSGNGYRKIIEPQYDMLSAELMLAPDHKPIIVYSRLDTAFSFLNVPAVGILHRLDTMGNDDPLFSFDGKVNVQGNNIGTRLDGGTLHSDGNIYVSGSVRVGLDGDYLAASFTTEYNTIGIPEEQPEENMVLYPNPARGSQVNIRMNTTAAGPTHMYLIDSKGAVISSLYSGVPATEHTLPIPSGLPAGHYFVRVQNMQGVFHLPLIYTGK